MWPGLIIMLLMILGLVAFFVYAYRGGKEDSKEASKE